MKFTSIFSMLAWLLVSTSVCAIERISLTTDGEQSNSNRETYAAYSSISSDGRFVAFDSYADDLVPNDNNDEDDVFVRDLLNNTTQIVSISSSGEYGDDRSYFSIISGNGRYVAFVSNSKNFGPFDQLGGRSIFVHDLQTGITKGVPNSAGGYSPSISEDGEIILFRTNRRTSSSKSNVFIYKKGFDISEPIEEVEISLLTGKEFRGHLEISSNGHFLAFQSRLNDLVQNDNNDTNDVFVQDLRTGSIELITVSSSGVQADDGGVGGVMSQVSISGDGRYVVFDSYARNLVANDVNRHDVFIRDRQLGTTELISVSSLGEQGNGESELATISDDGDFILFESAAFNLVGDDANANRDVFLHNRLTQTTELVSLGLNSIQSNRQSQVSRANFNGVDILFSSASNSLVEGDNNNLSDLFLVKNEAPINLVGRPQIDQSSESGVFIWREEDSNVVVVQFVAGAEDRTTEFTGSITASNLIYSLIPISIETAGNNADSLSQASNTKIEFELFINKPWRDAFSFMAEADQSLCLELGEYAGDVYLGPSKQKVSSSFDINFLNDCKTGPIAIDGAPKINPQVDSGLFVWRENGVWRNRLYGLGISDSVEVMSSGLISNLNPVSIESNDTLRQISPQHISLSSTRTAPYTDGFDFTANEETRICLETESFINSSGLPVFLGPERILVDTPIDLTTLSACDVASKYLNTKGQPEIDAANEYGVFLWQRDDDSWQAQFTAPPDPNTFNGPIEVSITSNEILKNVQGIRLEPSDILSILPMDVDATLKVISPYVDEIAFEIAPDSTTCFSVRSTFTSGFLSQPIFVGPYKSRVPNGVDLLNMEECN